MKNARTLTPLEESVLQTRLNNELCIIILREPRPDGKGTRSRIYYLNSDTDKWRGIDILQTLLSATRKCASEQDPVLLECINKALLDAGWTP